MSQRRPIPDDPLEVRLEQAEAELRGLRLERSEWRRVETSLRGSRNLYRSLFEHAPLLMLVVDDNAEVVLANALAGQEQPSSSTRDGAIGAAIRCVHHLDHPDGCGHGPSCKDCVVRSTVLDSIRTGKSHGQVEAKLDLADGHAATVSLSTSTVTHRGERLVLLSLHDISKRKLAESSLSETTFKLREVVRGANVGLWDWDLLTDTVQYSDEWKRQIGYEPEEIGSDFAEWFDRVHSEDLAATLAHVNEIVDGKRPHGSFEFRFHHRDGSYRWILAQASALCDETGRATRLLGSHIDITERKRVEEERTQLENQLAQAQRMESIGRLAGGIAHDVNNMVGVITGCAEVLLMGREPDDPDHETITDMLEAANESAELTRRLLGFASRQDIRPETLDLNEVVSRMLKMLRRLIRGDVEFVWKPSPDLWPVTMDPAQVDQILTNLLVNSQDAIGGPGTISVETRNTVFDRRFCALHPGAVTGRYATLSVADTGCGMSEETRQRVFEPFFTTKPPGIGTGLGLATVYGIVKQNRGYITIDSETDAGTTVQVHIPRTRNHSRATEDAAQDPLPRGNQEVILVAEDDARVLETTRKMLTTLGYRVLATPSGAEALATFREGREFIALLLTDVVMPGMSGPELAERVARLDPGLPVVFMSGHAMEAASRRGASLRTHDLLHKPFGMAALAHRIRLALSPQET